MCREAKAILLINHPSASYIHAGGPRGATEMAGNLKVSKVVSTPTWLSRRHEEMRDAATLQGR